MMNTAHFLNVLQCNNFIIIATFSLDNAYKTL